MQSIDWILVIAPIVLVVVFAIDDTRRFDKGVADSLAAGRCANRYLLANARGEADAGLANTMARLEIVLVSGFVLDFWDKVSVPIKVCSGCSSAPAVVVRCITSSRAASSESWNASYRQTCTSRCFKTAGASATGAT